MPCSENLGSVHLVFWPGTFLLIYLVAKHNQFGLKEAVLALVGVKKFQRTLLINTVLAATLLGSLGLAVWIIQTCPN
ncbi:hypothetical protein FHS89_000928 [Rubricella aquisinus]|uniref:Uncharacterized protein n=1 Tax=Rubricella aquisinus TaxID=2028108 RepID=A0A840WMN8_9RHOB|nr:hypothetical protein [Rubricella aquisinus]